VGRQQKLRSVFSAGVIYTPGVTEQEVQKITPELQAPLRRVKTSRGLLVTQRFHGREPRCISRRQVRRSRHNSNYD
jgi:hypothetical protein